MKKYLLYFLVSICCVFNVQAENLPDGFSQVLPKIKDWGNDPVLVSAVKAKNAEGETLEAVKKRDAEWRKIDGFDDQMKALMNNGAAKRLLELEKSEKYFFELFLMDNNGAIVAMTNKTSDYWQGDEAKWQESFKGGKGAVHIGEIEFDESAQDYLVQVSVPVMDGGAAIGAITIGIILDDL